MRYRDLKRRIDALSGDDRPEPWPPVMGLALAVAEIVRGKGEDLPEELPPRGGLLWALDRLGDEAWAEETRAQSLCPNEYGDDQL
jgi:hypothetical protein